MVMTSPNSFKFHSHKVDASVVNTVFFVSKLLFLRDKNCECGQNTSWPKPLK